ncbi:hypothetical protein F5883DRAFT_652089 [Diaporthe sp. PMI_573]|nr:hypothetical protein F5883DRAFT_652089 [Diaporthaceae sp. PMI_573]
MLKVSTARSSEAASHHYIKPRIVLYNEHSVPRKDPDLAAFLLQQEGIDVDDVDNDGNTPLLFAVEVGDGTDDEGIALGMLAEATMEHDFETRLNHPDSYYRRHDQPFNKMTNWNW